MCGRFSVLYFCSMLCVMFVICLVLVFLLFGSGLFVFCVGL